VNNKIFNSTISRKLKIQENYKLKVVFFFDLFK